MSKVPKPQHDIARTLRGLIPVQGAPKTLQEIRDQVRLLNEIRDPSDERLGRVIVAYFRDPRYNRGARFLKIDRLLRDEDLSARWTRVRIGPTVSKPAVGARGEPPNRKLIEEKLPTISATCARSTRTSFYLWDLLKEHFEVTRDNNRYYRQWLEALSSALRTDPRFVIIAVDVETDIPVEWMLAIDREQQIDGAVRNKLPELIAFMQRDESLVHLTRDLIHRFFAPRVVDETYDMHAYYRAVSRVLADTPSAIQISVQERARWIEAWCLRERIQRVIHGQLDSILNWLRAIGKPQQVDVILQQLLKSIPEITSTDALVGEVLQALSEDQRFLFDGPADRWRATPPGPPENLPAYHILWEHQRPLSDNALTEKARERFPTLYPDFNLADDNRFRIWRGDKWGLSQWIDINNWAYEYLREKKMALLATTVIAKVCKQHGVDTDVAMFTPEDDSRFIPRPHRRWYYRHAVTDAELDRMLELLRSADGRLTLDELVAQAISLDADDTDASERLTEDKRFVLVGGQWFAWEKAFYSLADEDMGELLAALRQVGTGLRLATLVLRVLSREAYLTDAEARLRADPRFREVLSGVWAAADLQQPSGERASVFNRPIRSERVPVVSEGEYTITEDLTIRESRPSGKRVSIQRRQITHTLSLLDVRHGNLVIDRTIASLMPPDEGQAVHFTDELGNEFTGWVDRENSLLQGLGNWFEARRLAFGDKIVIRATDQVSLLEIRPKGQRDERVYEEALQRQDVEKLIESARQTRKSYHDLMIEVMEYFNQAAGETVPLHREDIYNLVNYNRTASRSYIFSLLSLTTCPYEELRYFVPHGLGYWSFDHEKRKAFEMKMKELVERVEQLTAENEDLLQAVTSIQASEAESSAEIAKLTRQVHEQEVRIAELSTQNNEFYEANQRLSTVNGDQLRQIIELKEKVEHIKAENKHLQQVTASVQAGEAESREEIARLTQRVREQEACIKELSTQNNRFLEVNQRLSTINNDQLEQIRELETQVSSLNMQAAEQTTELESTRSDRELLRKELVDVQRDRKVLQELEEKQAHQIEELIQDKVTVEREIVVLRTKVEQLTSQNAALQENAKRLQNQVDTLTNEKIASQQRYRQAVIAVRSQLSARQQEYENLVKRSEARQRESQKELELERNRTQQLQERFEGGLKRLLS